MVIGNCTNNYKRERERERERERLLCLNWGVPFGGRINGFAGSLTEADLSSDSTSYVPELTGTVTT